MFRAADGAGVDKKILCILGGSIAGNLCQNRDGMGGKFGA